MQSLLAEIKTLVHPELASFDLIFKRAIQSRVKFMDIIMGYIIKRKGKQIRPLFVYLCAGSFGEMTCTTSRGAVLIELLHTATLVHDDVVDDSNYRRGFLSINSIWKNKVAVLAGDYLLSRGLLLAVNNGDFELLRIVADAIREMSEGELLQLEKAKKMNINESTYFDIIRQKTAVLLSSCCAVGAKSVGATDEQVLLAKTFGEKIGIAFQLRDDLLDYELSHSGKPASLDIQNRKLSLPLIYGLQRANTITRFTMWQKIRRKKKSPLDLSQLTNFAYDGGGIAYTHEKINQLLEEAKLLLSSFPPSIYRDYLEKLTDYVIEREH